jgi:predicted exporter
LNLKRALAYAWLAVFVLALAWLGWRFPQASLETSIFELVPWRAPNPAAQSASQALREQVERRILLLVGSEDSALAREGAEAAAAILRAPDSGCARVVCAVPPQAAKAALDFYAPRAPLLLAPEDRRLLESGGSLAGRSVQSLYAPAGFGGSLGFARDPLGTFGPWLSANAGLGGALAPRDGYLEIEDQGRTWVAVVAEVSGTAGAVGPAAERLDRSLNQACAAARGRGAQVLRSGFVFHEHAAAEQARREVSWVGLASTGLLAVLLWVVFRRPRPMALALLPAAIGCVAGAAAVLALWTKVHAVALVFGGTVVGVADDYGLYFLSGLYGSFWDPQRRLKAAFAPLTLAMGTSVLGYAALALLPIPALKQVAVFASVGLLFDWAGVVLWYPRLTKGFRRVAPTLVLRADRLRAAWPRWGSKPATIALTAALVTAGWGWSRLKIDDDVRLLYARDGGLAAEQDRVQALSGIGGSSGFFVVEGRDAQETLRREEALVDALAGVGPQRWRAVSDFVPSLERQARDRDLIAGALSGEKGAVAALADAAGDPGPGKVLRRWAAATVPPLTPEEWLAAAVSLPYRGQWLERPDGGVETLVLPGPGVGPTELERAAPLAAKLEGVQYVDQLRSVSVLLRELRRLLFWVLALGTLGVLGALWLRLGAGAWAALFPALLGGLVGVGALGLLGLSVNLFVALALLLLLGTAVDFGIYMLDGGGRSSFVAVQVAALTNIAAVGVLAFSGTPALRAFGVVLGVGATAAWLAASALPERKPHA